MEEMFLSSAAAPRGGALSSLMNEAIYVTPVARCRGRVKVRLFFDDVEISSSRLGNWFDVFC